MCFQVTIIPTSSADIYRRIKRRVGHSLKRRHCKGNLVLSRKQVAHKSLGTKGGLSSPKRVPRPLFKQHSPGSHRQHNSGCLYQQRRGDEVGLSVSPTVENPVLVHQETGNSRGTSHPRPAERDIRQAIQTWPDHSNREIPSPRSVSSYMLPVAPASSGLVCHQIQQQTPTVCITRSRPPGLGSGCTQPVLGKSGPICFPTSSHLGQSGGEVTGLPLQQGHSDHPRVAPQRGSTRSVYEAKWTIFTVWCLSNQVDFRTPPLKAIADFLLHLFQDMKLQPGAINSYRSAIADKLGNSTINVSKDENLTRLLDSFHRDRPKGRRGIPSWNLSLVFHQLTKAPFEPLKEASLKHLIFKTIFLLALASGKRRSEIHAWLHKNIRHQSDWSKVSLYPSPSFLSKNQLAKEGPDSVAPVVIPALAPTLDKSLKGDRSLCPVRALRYYLDRTSDLRQNKELVFVSYKKGLDKDISPATISSCIKQTVILCYELSDQEALTLYQVKAHDVRVFAASKAFQSGVSIEQILSACHFKSHNTFSHNFI